MSSKTQLRKPKFKSIYTKSHALRKRFAQDSYHVCEKCGKAVKYKDIRDAYGDGSYAVCTTCYGKYYRKKRRWKVAEITPYQDKADELLKEFKKEDPKNEYKTIMEYGKIHDPSRPLFKILSRPKR